MPQLAYAFDLPAKATAGLAIGAVGLAKPSPTTEAEAAIRTRLSVELNAAIVHARPEIEGAVARRDAAAAASILGDLAIMFSVPEG